MFQCLVCKLNTLKVLPGQFCTFVEFSIVLYLKQVYRAPYNNVVCMLTRNNITTVAVSLFSRFVCQIKLK